MRQRLRPADRHVHNFVERYNDNICRNRCRRGDGFLHAFICLFTTLLADTFIVCDGYFAALQGTTPSRDERLIFDGTDGPIEPNIQTLFALVSCRRN